MSVKMFGPNAALMPPALAVVFLSGGPSLTETPLSCWAFRRYTRTLSRPQVTIWSSSYSEKRTALMLYSVVWRATTSGLPPKRSWEMSHSTMSCLACASKPTPMRARPSCEMSTPTMPLAWPFSTATHSPVRKSHSRTTADLPSCALAMSWPSPSNARATTCAVWPRKKRWAPSADACIAMMTAPAVNTISSEWGGHLSVRVSSPWKALMRSKVSTGSGSGRELRGGAVAGLGERPAALGAMDVDLAVGGLP
mmetsp:Transcript_21840/g.56955  ORF Transcript_21840/g.56955 Transcript_21840/m.56955 type:complete len:252 (+) Transcript_21840:1534-2289(+)